MLTFHQLDTIVHKTLLTLKDFEFKRREEGIAILYDIHERHESVKRFLGTYRVWEWHDGSARCGWMPLETGDPQIVRMRNLVWEAVTAATVPANLPTEDSVT